MTTYHQQDIKNASLINLVYKKSNYSYNAGKRPVNNRYFK